MKHIASTLLFVTTFFGCSHAGGDQPAAKPVAAAPASAPAPEVQLKQFINNKVLTEDLRTIYPPGKAFTIKAPMKDTASCYDGVCELVLGDGNDYEHFDVDESNKPKLDGKPAGTVIALECVPVYEAYSKEDPSPTLQTVKSCHVI